MANTEKNYIVEYEDDHVVLFSTIDNAEEHAQRYPTHKGNEIYYVGRKLVW